jgi:hypothetical protein
VTNVIAVFSCPVINAPHEIGYLFRRLLVLIRFEEHAQALPHLFDDRA